MTSFYDDVRASRVTSLILAAGLAMQVLFVVLHGINKEFLDDRLFLALDRDPNLPSWTETALFVVAGLAIALLAWLKPAARIPLAVLALLAFLLSLEQMAQIHGDVERQLGDLATLVMQPLMAGGLILAVAWAARHLPSLSRTLLWAAIVSIAVAQGSSLVNLQLDPPYVVIIFFQTLEEVGEISTAVLLVAAAAQPLIDSIVARVLADQADHGRPEPDAPSGRRHERDSQVLFGRWPSRPAHTSRRPTSRRPSPTWSGSSSTTRSSRSPRSMTTRTSSPRP
jgi:hypothetical protein